MNQRHLAPEIMDQPGLDVAEHVRALRALGRINRLSLTAGTLFDPIARLEAHSGGIRLLDIATGGGDVPIEIESLARRRGVPLVAHGCDFNSDAVGYARELARTRGSAAEFFVLDAKKDALPSGYDVLTCSLFMHHLEEAEAGVLLRRMCDSARRMVVVSDLERSRAGLTLAYMASRGLTRSRVVHADGPQSVAAAFTAGEAAALAERAGLGAFEISRHWPYRWRLAWQRPE